MSATIPLTKGYSTIVDEADYAWLSQWKWQLYTKKLAAGKVRHAAIRTARRADGGRFTVYMHRELLETDEQVDHKNLDPLDNRRENLRAATNQQNQRNTKKKGGESATSEYKGVGWHKQAGEWRARIGMNGKRVSLGGFSDPTDAARAYDDAAREHFGEFAVLNFPDEPSREERDAEEQHLAELLVARLRRAS